MPFLPSVQYDYNFPSEFDQKSTTYFSDYLHNSIIPDLTINLQGNTDFLKVALIGNYKVNQPKLSTTSLTTPSLIYQTDEKIKSMSFSVYGLFTTGLLKVKASVIYGQNMREFALMGGYAISKLDSVTGHEQYSSLNNMFTWLNVVYGNSLQGGIFIGFEKNLGATAKSLYSVTSLLSRGYNINNLYRISPTILYKTGKLQFQAEVEYTVAAYGKVDLNDYGLVKGAKNISNIRVQFSTFFYF